MHELYDLGYMEIRKADRLQKFVELTGALVVDVRFSPWSSDPAWRKANLERLLEGGYTHLKELGNKNYKGGEIDIVDLPAGLEFVARKLEMQPIIIMCGCWDREHCHRLVVVKAFEDKYGVASTHLTNQSIVGSSQDDPKQLPLF